MAATAERTTAELRELAKRHLWLQNTEMAPYHGGAPLPIVIRGDGCYVWDADGNRYLDGLSALFCVNIGHGRSDVAQAGVDQAEQLGFFPNWSATHRPAVELATKVAALAPGDLNRVFFTSGGGESVDSALKLCRQFHRLRGNAGKYKVIARVNGFHGMTMGGLSATGVTSLRAPFEPLVPGGCHVPSTNAYRLPSGHAIGEFAEAIAERIEFEGPETVSAVILEPVQNSGGCIPPPEGYLQRVREICDANDVLLISDDVICSWGRLGEWFGAQRFDYCPDIITTAKGITSAYAPLGAVIASDRVMEPFLEASARFSHGFTYGGHPMAAAVALANIDVIERENLNAHVREHEAGLRGMLESLRDLDIVGDVRGAGYMYAIELVKDRDTRMRFDKDEARALIQRVIGPELFRRGLICRCDDRGGDVVIVLAPPLIAGPAEFAEIESVLRPVLADAAQNLSRHGSAAAKGA
jgi:adenosylmethionine-8-amino-7-oxononanoate aminotransferase